MLRHRVYSDVGNILTALCVQTDSRQRNEWSAVKQRWCVILRLCMFTATAPGSVKYLLPFLSNEETHLLLHLRGIIYFCQEERWRMRLYESFNLVVLLKKKGRDYVCASLSPEVEQNRAKWQNNHMTKMSKTNVWGTQTEATGCRSCSILWLVWPVSVQFCTNEETFKKLSLTRIHKFLSLLHRLTFHLSRPTLHTLTAVQSAVSQTPTRSQILS